MSPHEAAAEVLAALLTALPQPPGESVGPTSAAGAWLPADQRLRDFLRRHPELGKRERVQVADWIFDVLRNLRLYQELARARLPGGHASAERARELVDIARAAAGPADPAGPVAGFAEPVRYSLPDWLWERLQAAHGARTAAIAGALLQPSPIDVRANLLVGKADALRRRLAEHDIEAVAIEGVPTGLRITGRPNLERLDLFEQGWFEVQDAGSQRIVDACGARRGQLVIDFCAGAGGKSLALAARMRNSGKVMAFDTGEDRLSRLMPRARRARAVIVEPLRLSGATDSRLERYRRRADVVLVDAPCSGTGTLRRSPDLKWRLSPERLLKHVQEQQEILGAASLLVKPGGILVYATCSLLQEENGHQVAGFGRAGFELGRTSAWLPDEGPSSSFFLAKWYYRHNNGPRPVQYSNSRIFTNGAQS